MTLVDDLVVLVDAPTHERYGQIGKLLAHDFLESGNYIVKFIDSEHSELFPDGEVKGDPKSLVSTYYRFRNEKAKIFDKKNCGPERFVRQWMRHNPNKPLIDLVNQYKNLFNEDF